MNGTLTTIIKATLAPAEARVREALAAEGFGILTFVDVQATLREKLGIETKPYHILGACNPKLAHQGMEAVPEIGAFLPCGVALWEEDGQTHVAAQDPELIAGAEPSGALNGMAKEVRARLSRALAAAGSA